MLSRLAVATLLAVPLTKAALSAQDHDHAPVAKRLPAAWYQTEDHPVHSLFKRQSVNDGVTYAAVGSEEWTNAYPSGLPDNSQLPQEWVNALNAAVTAGKIPDIPQSHNAPDQDPKYPDGLDPMSPKICSGTYQCKIPGDIWEAPEGYLGCGFDDGPLPASDKLYQFLQQNNQHATHFFIGTNILENPKQFLMAFETLQNDIAVHTWTHPYMTTLSNMDIIAQFGWTMELIHNSTGGRVPKFWRPPYGDTDVRVSAIAHEVFGMTAILWNQDTEDWSLTTGGTTAQKISASMNKWLTGPKNPGLIILEHELDDQCVKSFMSAYPIMKSSGWNIVSAAQLSGAAPYQNSLSSNAPVIPANGVVVGDIKSSSVAPSSTTASSSTAPSSTSGSESSKSSGNKTGSAVALRNGMASSSWLVSGIAVAAALLVVSLLA